MNEDGKTWNGFIGVLIDGEIDICTGPLTQTKPRSEVVDFTVPLAEEILSLIAPAAGQEKAVQYWVYKDIFSNLIWISAFSLMVLFSMTLFVISKLSR